MNTAGDQYIRPTTTQISSKLQHVTLLLVGTQTETHMSPKKRISTPNYLTYIPPTGSLLS
jgi:hypothetical protein